MRFPGFIGPSYTLDSRNVDSQRCVNLFPEVNELGTGKEAEVAALVRTPGLRLLLTLAKNPIRGVYCASNGELYAVGGDKLYSISDAWVATEVGTMADPATVGTGPVSMADNGTTLVVVDGTYGYTWNMSTDVFATITDPEFLGADQVTFQDGYFLFNRPSTQQFFISGINDVTFDGLDIASVEGFPDVLVGLVSDLQNVYMFGTKSTEIFYNSGNADFPFQRTQGALIEVGCAAAFSIAKLQNQVFWLGQDASGRGIVYSAQGYQPKRISTHAIEKIIADLGDSITDARAFTYQQNGHGFYCLNLRGAETTLVFDTVTNLWHERAYLNLGSFQRHRADCHAFAHDKNVVGDYQNGKIYALDPDTYTDAGDYILRERSAPHISKSGKNVFHQEFQLDVETGVGIDGSGQGTDPQAMLQWSDDGGHSWSHEHWRSIGAIGDRRVRVTWRRLGRSRDRVYRVRFSDPCKLTIVGANLILEEAAA